MKPKKLNIRTCTSFIAPAIVILIWMAEMVVASRMRQLPNSLQNKHRSTTDLASNLGIKKDAQGHCDREPVTLKLWISPYRPFPEAGDPGLYRSRHLGDYEYLSLLRGDPCTRLRINYGAFKYSPAHKVFEKAKSQGVYAEMMTAKQLGFDKFALDLNKVWMTSNEFKQRCQSMSACRITSDNFAIVNLKDDKASANIIEALRDVEPKSQSLPMEYFKGLMGFGVKDWEEMESSADGRSLWTWFKGSGQNRTFSLSGKRMAAIPANLDVTLMPAPSIAKIDILMNCSNGAAIRRLSAKEEIHISSTLRDCQPETIEIEHFITKNSHAPGLLNQGIPPLGPNDDRRSLFAIAAKE